MERVESVHCVCISVDDVFESGFHSVVAFFSSTCYSPAMDCAIQEKKNAIFFRRWKESTFKESYILVCFLSLRAFAFHFTPFFLSSVVIFGFTVFNTTNYVRFASVCVRR